MEHERLILTQLEATTSELIREPLLDALKEAQNLNKSDSLMGTIARVVEACNAIETGEAARLAAKVKLDSKSFGGARPRINFESIALYVRVREKLDIADGRKTEWGGPRAETIHRNAHLKQYVQRRRDALHLRPRPAIGSRERRIEEIVGRIKPLEDQQDLRFALGEGDRARREVVRLKKVIEDEFPELGQNALAVPRATDTRRQHKLDPTDAQILRDLVQQLTSVEHLQWFGLTFDGRRLKMIDPPQSHLINADQFAALTRAANMQPVKR